MASIQRAQEIQGVPTNLVVHSFGDRIVIFITQLGKIGCLIQASIPSSVPLLPPPPLPAFPPPPTATTLTPLLGHPPDARSVTLFNLYAAQVSRAVCGKVRFFLNIRRLGGRYCLDKGRATKQAPRHCWPRVEAKQTYVELRRRGGRRRDLGWGEGDVYGDYVNANGLFALN
ncbi:hypothetical protein FRC08_012909 [Ceratobasidium sp. 394]|nr:hypothetical protein FRC08_012909 [Ceratobasidium sp. 394]